MAHELLEEGGPTEDGTARVRGRLERPSGKAGDRGDGSSRGGGGGEEGRGAGRRGRGRRQQKRKTRARDAKQPAKRRGTEGTDWVGAVWGGWGRAEGSGGEGWRGSGSRGREGPTHSSAHPPGPASSPRPFPPFFWLSQHELQAVHPRPRAHGPALTCPSLPPRPWPLQTFLFTAPAPAPPQPKILAGKRPLLPCLSPAPEPGPRPLLRPPACPRALTRSPGIRLRSARARRPDATLRHRRRCSRRHRQPSQNEPPRGPAPGPAQDHAPERLMNIHEPMETRSGKPVPSSPDRMQTGAGPALNYS